MVDWNIWRIMMTIESRGVIQYVCIQYQLPKLKFLELSLTVIPGLPCGPASPGAPWSPYKGRKFQQSIFKKK